MDERHALGPEAGLTDKQVMDAPCGLMPDVFINDRKAGCFLGQHSVQNPMDGFMAGCFVPGLIYEIYIKSLFMISSCFTGPLVNMNCIQGST
ncbi:hypothetical protein RAA17_14710 [Komagataeibacter rhaeticus]|nr:hypothetical protein [Komagataeibacter rhaeticus]